MNIQNNNNNAMNIQNNNAMNIQNNNNFCNFKTQTIPNNNFNNNNNHFKTQTIPNHINNFKPQPINIINTNAQQQQNVRNPLATKSLFPNAKMKEISPSCERHIRQLLAQGSTSSNIRGDVCGRHSLNVHSKVMIYSVSQTSWFCGIITNVIKDPNSGTWLKVEYRNLIGKASSKFVKRFDKEIMPFQPKPESMSVQEFHVRNDWIIGDQVEVHSVSQNRWTAGRISSIDYDHQGEWIRVVYQATNNRKVEKQVKRYCKVIRNKVNAPILPIPVQPEDPVVPITTPAPLDTSSSGDGETHIPLWARKENLDRWITSKQDCMDPEKIFPTDLEFRTVDLVDIFEASMMLETSEGKRPINERRQTADWSHDGLKDQEMVKYDKLF